MEPAKYCLLIAICWLGISFAVCEAEEAPKTGITAQQLQISPNACTPPRSKDCDSYIWKPFNQLVPTDNLEYAGYDNAGEVLYICRFPINGQMAIGKANRDQRGCWVAHYGMEIRSSATQDFEVLVNPQRIKSVWVETIKGAILPTGSIEGGHDGNHLTYVARCSWVSQYGGEVTPGPLHRDMFGITVRDMFVPFWYVARECTGANTKIEVLTCNEF